MTVKCTAGIDLHSNNLFCAIVDMRGRRLFEKKLPCHLESVLQARKPFRKRLQRTSLILSLKSLHTWMTGRDLGTGAIKALQPKDAETLFEHPADQLITGLDLALVEPLGRSIGQIEAAILAAVKGTPNYQVLQTMPGVGKTLGFTIAP